MRSQSNNEIFQVKIVEFLPIIPQETSPRELFLGFQAPRNVDNQK